MGAFQVARMGLFRCRGRADGPHRPMDGLGFQISLFQSGGWDNRPYRVEGVKFCNRRSGEQQRLLAPTEACGLK